jgi:TPR repeat protein
MAPRFGVRGAGRVLAAFVGASLLLAPSQARAFFITFKPFDEPPETSIWLDLYREMYRTGGHAALEAAAARGDRRAEYALVTLSMDGDPVNDAGVHGSRASLQQQLRALADAGIVEASWLLGTMSQRCEFAGTCGRSATEALEVAVAADYPPALALLGVLSLAHSRNADDRARAVALFERAAAAGSAIAKTNLALELARTEGVETDPFSTPRGHRLLDDAAAAGEPIALLHAARRLASQQGPDDTGPAQLALLRRAIAARSGHAELALAALFLRQPALRDPDVDRTVVDLLCSACQRGATAACGPAADAVLDAGNDEASRSLAVRMLQVGTAAGDVQAHAVFGEELRKGDRIAGDAARAAEHTRRAADLGDLTSQFNVGLMLLKGEGVEADAQLARIYFERAAAAGHARARRVLDDLAKD